MILFLSCVVAIFQYSNCIEFEREHLYCSLIAKEGVHCWNWGAYLIFHLYSIDFGKCKTLKCGNRSAETEVQKRKCRNRSTEVRRKAAYLCFCIIDSRICVLRPCRQKGGSISCIESWIFDSRNVASVAITNCAMCMWEPDPNQDKRRVHGPTMWALCSWNDLKVMQMRVLS